MDNMRSLLLHILPNFKEIHNFFIILRYHERVRYIKGIFLIYYIYIWILHARHFLARIFETKIGNAHESNMKILYPNI